MQQANRPLRVSETALIIQAQIEGLTPNLLLLRDKLVKAQVPNDVATLFVRYLKVFPGIGSEEEEGGTPSERVVNMLTRLTIAQEALEVLVDWCGTTWGLDDEAVKRILDEETTLVQEVNRLTATAPTLV